MEKHRKVKKVEMASQKPSSSKKNWTMDKTGQKESKTKVQKSSINDLPPEMLMEVLKNVDSKSLIACRLVNRKWNGIASEILQSRPDVELEFNYSNNNGTAKFTYNRRRQDGERSLFDLIKCFKKSKNFPFGHFCFSQVDLRSFDQKDWIKFISDLGEKIKGIKLEAKLYRAISTDKDLIKMMEKVRNLLVSKLPELEKFGLQFNNSEIPNSSTIKLFPTSAESLSSKPSTSKGSKTSKVQLPHLKVLYLDESMLSTYTGIATDLLCASVNLQKLETFNKNGKYKALKNFQLLQSLGKLAFLQAVQIEPVEFLSKKLEENTSQFKLRTLDLNMMKLYKNENLWSDAAVLLSKLFESNKDTLRELEMDPLGFLDDLQLPKFNKLSSLSTHERYSFEDSLPVSLLPSEINPMEIFPVLRSLVLRVPWSTAFPNEDNISGIPTLEILKVAGKGMKEKFIPQISLLCPNLKEFEISRDDTYPMKNFPKVGRAIWIHLKKLQSLIIYCLFLHRDEYDDEFEEYYDSSDDDDDDEDIDDAFPAFDSCITGFSRGACERLYKISLAAQLLQESGSRVRVPKSELKAKRKFPSILDLKDLKSFELHVLCSNREDDLPFNTDIEKMGPTPVSKKCVLELMDNFTYNINKTIKGL